MSSTVPSGQVEVAAGCLRGIKAKSSTFELLITASRGRSAPMIHFPITMRIAFDTHHLLLETAGTKRVTVNFLDQLRREHGADLIELRPSYKLSVGKSIPAKLLGHLIRFFWVHIHLPLLCLIKKADVLISPEFNTPMLTHCRRVVIVHDAHMRAQPEFTSRLWFYFYYVPFIEIPIRRADLILTISAFAKKQIVSLMKLDERKVRVMHLGVDMSFRAQPSPLNGKVREKGLSPGNYILFVGTFEARKNLERLINAFAKIKGERLPQAEGLQLAIVGKPAGGMFSDRSRQMTGMISGLGLQDDIVLTGYVRDEDLPEFYREARMLAFPSLHEGFGLPILEGFISGIPVITSNVCSMPEIAGGAALIVDPYNVEDIADKIRQLLVNTSLRDELVEAGSRRVKEFSWERFTNEALGHISALKR